MNQHQIAKFWGSTEAELKEARHHWRGILDPRALFSHQGELLLAADQLQLGDWLRLSREDILAVAHKYTPVYPRWLGGGIRGQGPSLGFFTRGEPLLIETRRHGRLYLLIDYHWLSGFNQSRRWRHLLENWLQQQERAL